MNQRDKEAIVSLDIGTQNQAMQIRCKNFTNQKFECPIISISSGKSTESNKESSTIYIKIGEQDRDQVFVFPFKYTEYDRIFTYVEEEAFNDTYCIVKNYKQDFCRNENQITENIDRNFIGNGQETIQIPLKHLFTFNYMNALFKAFSKLNTQQQSGLISEITFIVCVPAESTEQQKQFLRIQIQRGYELARDKYDSADIVHTYIPPQFNENMIKFRAEPECGSFDNHVELFIKDKDKFMVVDCGAGTFDISVFRKNGQRNIQQQESIKCIRGGADMQKFMLDKFSEYLDNNNEIHELLSYQFSKHFSDYSQIANIMRQNNNNDYNMSISNDYIINKVNDDLDLKRRLFDQLQDSSNQDNQYFKLFDDDDNAFNMMSFNDFEISNLTIQIKRILYTDAINDLIRQIFDQIQEQLVRIEHIDKILCIGGFFEMERAYELIKQRFVHTLNLNQDQFMRHLKPSTAVIAGAISYYVSQLEQGQGEENQ